MPSGARVRRRLRPVRVRSTFQALIMVVASRVAIAAAAGAAAAAIWHAYYRRRATLSEPQMTSEEQEETTNVGPARPNEPEPTIEKLSDDILALLKKYKPVEVDGMDPALHYLAPHVPKVRWTELGDLVAGREKATFGAVDGARWMTLRLDGCGFSKAVRLMRKKGVLEPSGFSAIFAETMVSCLRLLLEHFDGAIGYTQSDEMVIFIPPASIVRGEQQGHARNGRVTKIATLAASLCTAHFVMELSGRCITAGVGLEGLSQLLPHFDCRVGSFSSWEEARACCCGARTIARSMVSPTPSTTPQAPARPSRTSASARRSAGCTPTATCRCRVTRPTGRSSSR